MNDKALTSANGGCAPAIEATEPTRDGCVPADGGVPSESTRATLRHIGLTETFIRHRSSVDEASRRRGACREPDGALEVRRTRIVPRVIDMRTGCHRIAPAEFKMPPVFHVMVPACIATRFTGADAPAAGHDHGQMRGRIAVEDTRLLRACRATGSLG